MKKRNPRKPGALLLALVLSLSLVLPVSAAESGKAALGQTAREAAAAAIRAGYAGWSERQTYLHIVTNHDAVDAAEAMYHRCLAFAESEEASELRAELAELQDQLRLLAEMEEFSLKNVL